MKTVIGVDVGTTHIKSILFDAFGSVLREEKLRTPLTANENGPVYAPEELYRIVREQICRLCASCKEKPLGISITGMAEAGLIVDRASGKALTDILPWFDDRTCALADKMTSLEEEEAFLTTGLRNSFKYGIYKFLWLLNENNLDRQRVIWLSMCDYIAYRLTGEFVTDPTFAARTYVYNVLQGKWDQQRMESYGVEAANFPKIVESGVCFGCYEGIPVAIAGHDHICAAFGLLYKDRKGICDSAGTSETYVGIIEDFETLKKEGFSKDSGLLYGPFVDGGYFYMANIPSSGHSIEWFRKKLQMQELSYEEMNQKLLKLSKDPTGILYFPYLTGMGAPLYEADRSGVILGIKESQDGLAILKGMMEGIQYQAKWLLSIVEQYHGSTSPAIFCAGGAVHNETLMQMKADILKKSVKVPSVSEATLSGAAAIFLHKNMGNETAEIFLKKPMTVHKKYVKDDSRAQAYDEIFGQGYLPFVNLLKYQKLTEKQN